MFLRRLEPECPRGRGVVAAGRVNLLHIAVLLTASTGPDDPDDAHLPGPQAEVDAARARLQEASEAAEADQDSFFPDLFHATVLIEEPEAHLHPKLQYGLIRYLNKVAGERRDLQLIVTSHSGELASAVDPADLIVVRSVETDVHVARSVAALPLPNAMRAKLFQLTRLHMDADRSGALFADRLLVVEGVTEAALLRTVGRVWAADDPLKTAFVESLSILPVGHVIGEWPVRLLATPGYELVQRVAALSDTDLRGDPLPEPSPPEWHEELSAASARFFWSRPTLEPTMVTGNEELVGNVLSQMDLAPMSAITPELVDSLFITKRRKKASFALLLARRIADDPTGVQVPEHIAELFDWLYGEEAIEQNDQTGV
jgi:putative ATP-dependent endonuclease of the OLD family